MNIWKLSVNENFNDVFLINEIGNQCFEKDSFFKEIHTSPQMRTLDHKEWKDVTENRIKLYLEMEEKLYRLYKRL